MTFLFNVVRWMFFVFLGLFLLGGISIVAIQAAGVLLSSGGIVTWVNEWLAPMTFTFATACAVCAFVMNYEKYSEKSE